MSYGSKKKLMIIDAARAQYIPKARVVFQLKAALFIAPVALDEAVEKRGPVRLVWGVHCNRVRIRFNGRVGFAVRRGQRYITVESRLEFDQRRRSQARKRLVRSFLFLTQPRRLQMPNFRLGPVSAPSKDVHPPKIFGIIHHHLR